MITPDHAARTLARLRHACRDVVRARRVESELDEELDAYVDLLTAEKSAAGMSADDAHRAAVATLGGRERVKALVRSQRFQLLVPLARTAYVGTVIAMTFGVGIAANVGLRAIQRSVVAASAGHAPDRRPAPSLATSPTHAATVLGAVTPARATLQRDTTLAGRDRARLDSGAATRRGGKHALTSHAVAARAAEPDHTMPGRGAGASSVVVSPP